MSLTKYTQKRNFQSTSEPKGVIKRQTGDLIFVVQKHAASHLHFDFRLEFEGVLKSWAIPKGPSLNPVDKRLAIQVEDHPYGYNDFEGNIPTGNYGAGNVIVWDNGTYSATGAMNASDNKKRIKAGLLKGHLGIILKGKKLKGEFDLIHLKGKDENAWLLIKKDDRYASTSDVLKKRKSVISNLTIESLQKKQEEQKAGLKKNNTPGKTLSVEVQKKVPFISSKKSITSKKTKIEFVNPMLAESAAAPFDDGDWVFEVKYDGYRTIAMVVNGEVNLRSRNELSFDLKFKPIADALKKLQHNVILDGEVVVEDKNGRSDFQLLQNYLKTGEGILKYYVFDLLNLDGIATTHLKLSERKELLRILIRNVRLKNVYYSKHIAAKGIAFYNKAIEKNLEGVIAKDSGSPYRPGKRSGEWLKVRISKQEEAIVIGITTPKGGRSYFGSLLLAQMDGKELKYVGNCGSGFTDATLKELYTMFKSSFIKSSPLSIKTKTSDKIQWIKPKFVVQVKYTEVTTDGMLRHPVFIGLRQDKKAKEVKLDIISNEKPSTPKRSLKNTGENIPEVASERNDGNNVERKVGRIILQFTNQQKIYFPESGITKGDVVEYYNEVAEVMLPYLINRPQSMNRFPSGINGQSFYQKDVDTNKIPFWLKTQKVYSESNKEDIDYLLCNDKATLLYMANLGCIEINPWNSTVIHLNYPDWLVIDIDPSKDDFKEVIRTALVVRDILEELETASYCKTSGATGLHVYVPLGGKYTYDSVKIFAEWIASEVVKRLPETTTIVRSVQKRNDKIYIDFLQNRRGQTLAAPYSVRPKSGATVSTPIEWSELNKKLLPSDFTLKNTMKRLQKKGDLWKPVLGKGADLKKIIDNLTQ